MRFLLKREINRTILSGSGGGSVVVDSKLIVTPIVRFCNCSMFCCALLYVHSSLPFILMGKRELVALLCLSSLCLVTVCGCCSGCLGFVCSL